ncbi:MAG: MerR family transcriptional regulator [Eubacteriales bacterium]
MKEKYLISEAAKQVEVESHVLRYWEEELEIPIKRNEQGHRYYTQEDIECFLKIKGWKEKGLQLKAIRTMIFDRQRDVIVPIQDTSKEEKSIRLQMLMKHLIFEAVSESNEEIIEQLKDTMIKEIDYQFREKEEHDVKREQDRIVREEEHYRKLDELIRGAAKKKEKRKKHSFF